LSLNDASLNILNGIVFNNRTITLNPQNQRTAIAIGAASQSWSGTGTIVLAGARNDSEIGRTLNAPSAGTLTIGSGITLRSGGASGVIDPLGFTNNGTVSAQSATKTISLTTSAWSNNGTIEVLNGGAFNATSSPQPGNLSGGVLSGGHWYA